MDDLDVVDKLTGLGFPEALRWREGALWFSDMFRGKVMRWRPNTNPEVVVSNAVGGPQMPGGLGWLPNNTLLLVDCLERRILSWSPQSGISLYADLSALTTHPLNDMYVAPDGTAWVGGYGFDPETETPVASALYKVTTDREIARTNSEFIFPNGTDSFGSRIAVAETFGDRVSFLDESGGAIGSQSWPNGSGPDGLSFAPDGRLFVALAFTSALDELRPNGDVRRIVQLATENSAATPGGQRGIFDCAVHPTESLLAYSSASLDEAYGQIHDTGSITLIRLGS